MKNKLFAVADIHGNKKGVTKALQKANIIDSGLNWCAGKSTLVNLGDACDRGEDSAGVIDLLLKIKKQAETSGGKVHLLWGNHERMVFDGIKNRGWRECWLQNGGFVCIESYCTIMPIDENGKYDYFNPEIPNIIYKYHKEYFDSLEQFVIIDGNLFVHAGVHVKGDLDSLTAGRQLCNNGKLWLWIREQFYDYPNDNFLKNYGVKRIIFGHTPATLYINKDRNSFMTPVEKLNGKLLCIDTGSYHPLGGVCVVELTEDSYRIAGIEYNV